MKHFRPIKTFATWLLDTVEVEFMPDPSDPWASGQHADEWIQQVLGLKRNNQDCRLDFNIYNHGQQGFPKAGRLSKHGFHFPDADSANLFHAQFGGVRKVLDIKDNPRKNEAIEANFTMDDLVSLYGDPLPNIIQFHLVDMADRLNGYFERFKFMHQHWADRAHWIPSAFVYVPPEIDRENGPARWLYNMLHREGQDEELWIRGWEASAFGVYEFDDPSIAAMFKLAFGGGPIPSTIHYRKDGIYEKLAGPVSGIKPPVGRSGTWERQANIPDYRNPQVVG